MRVAEETQKTNWKTVGVFFLVFPLVFVGLANLLGLTALVEFTNGLINTTLLNTLLGTLLLVVGVAFWYGGLRPRDVGLVLERLPIGIGLTVFIWVVFTAIQFLYSLYVGDFSVHPDWTNPGATETFGVLLGQVFGNAPFEELAFRGFLLVQLYLLLDGKWWQDNHTARVATAIVGSSLPFALLHLPLVLWADVGLDLSHVGLVFVLGSLLALVYIRTRNIFFTIGLHAMMNFPAPVFAAHTEYEMLFQLGWVVPALLIVIAWPRLPFVDDEGP